jgi:hypothetical protein
MRPRRGWDAYDLGHYGTDHNGISDPVLLTSFGSGQNALYAYVLIPFVYHSLTPLTVRLPMLVRGSCPCLCSSFLPGRYST